MESPYGFIQNPFAKNSVSGRRGIIASIESMNGYGPSLLNRAGYVTSSGITANRAIYCPFYVDETVVADRAMIIINTSAGNIDLGVYNQGGTRIASTGSVASPGTSVQVVSFTAPVTLIPGSYYFATAGNNASLAPTQTTSLGGGFLDFGGAFDQETAFPLPSSLTFDKNPAGQAMWFWELLSTDYTVY